jgi:perosamine synthetase
VEHRKHVNIPISKIDLSDSVDLVLQVLQSGKIAQGELVEIFEKQFAELSGVNHAVAVNNGTSALYLALRAEGIGEGDEVITTPFTFGATLNSILFTGATVKLVDINVEDFNLSSALIEGAISSKTKAILPVHLYGQTCEMDLISSIAEKYNLKVIEDAAQAAFSKFSNKHAGAFGTGCFSFYATKNFTSGEGGIITTNSEVLSEKLRILRNQGMKAKYDYSTSSLNFRMTDVQAAIVLPQLSKRTEIKFLRSRNASFLNNLLSQSPILHLPKELAKREHVWHQYTVVLGDSSPIGRDELVRKLNERGIGAGVYYPKLVHDYPCFENHPRIKTTDLPIATSIAKTCFSLPEHQYLTEDDLVRIASEVLEILS